MDWYLITKTIHIISSTILFGTGLGTAFFFLCSHFTDNLHEKFFATRTTVLADYFFTAPAVILQPLSGAWLIWKGGFDPAAPWLIYASTTVRQHNFWPLYKLNIRTPKAHPASGSLIATHG